MPCPSSFSHALSRLFKASPIVSVSPLAGTYSDRCVAPLELSPMIHRVRCHPQNIGLPRSVSHAILNSHSASVTACTRKRPSLRRHKNQHLQPYMRHPFTRLHAAHCIMIDPQSRAIDQNFEASAGVAAYIPESVIVPRHHSLYTRHRHVTPWPISRWTSWSQDL